MESYYLLYYHHSGVVALSRLAWEIHNSESCFDANNKAAYYKASKKPNPSNCDRTIRH